MRHRHSGRYRSRKPRGGYTYKKRPLHRLSQRKKKTRRKIPTILTRRRRGGVLDEAQSEIEQELSRLKSWGRDISLYNVEQEAESEIIRLNTRREALNEELRDKRRLLTFNFDENTKREIQDEIDELVDEREEVKDAIQWLKDTDNLISFLPKRSWDDE